eukprot:TRINITY_DN7714_c0_g1_i1.p1 TRINITY_DN7714_c0_g1~~TRINITY_DN7714_c0_g1_i1.p1  ORF type:complete len:368 (+),score=117.12 TRINITY_DN7714_c0_g1_i1:72-1175(+)
MNEEDVDDLLWSGHAAVSPKVFLALRLPNACMPQERGLAGFSPLGLVQALCDEALARGVLMQRKNVVVLWAVVAGADGLPSHLEDHPGQARPWCRVFDSAAGASAGTDLAAFKGEVGEGEALVALRVAFQLADVPLSEGADEHAFLRKALRTVNAGIADSTSKLHADIRPRSQFLMHSCETQTEPLPDDDRKVAEQRYNSQIQELRADRQKAHQELSASLESLQGLQRRIVAAVRDGVEWDQLATEYREQERTVVRNARRDAFAHHAMATAEQRVTAESLDVDRGGLRAPPVSTAMDAICIASPAGAVRRRWRHSALPSAQAKRMKDLEAEIRVPASRHIESILSRAAAAREAAPPDPDFGELVSPS